MSKRALICYLSYSGNTEEIAELVEANLLKHEIEVQTYEIGFGVIPELSHYDYIFLGTFTWDQGFVPDEIKDFIIEVGYKPSNMYIFGSGDTQFGGDILFCKAVDKLTDFYNSPLPGLKIEQAPRGSQEELVSAWTNNIVKGSLNENKQLTYEV